MPPYPGPAEADDLRLSEALGTSGTAAAPRVLEVYGPFLYDYAHALLRDRDWAAEAVCSALAAVCAAPVEAAGLRAGLYGAVRRECLTRLADPDEHPGERVEAADAVLAQADDPGRLERGRERVMAALKELSGLEREAADLTLRHGLNAIELAAVLELSPREAAETSVRVQAALAGALTERTGAPITADRLPTALAVLPFARPPADLADRLRARLAEPDPIWAAELRRDPSGRYVMPPPPPPARRGRRTAVWAVTAAVTVAVLAIVLGSVLLPGSRHRHSPQAAAGADGPAGAPIASGPALDPTLDPGLSPTPDPTATPGATASPSASVTVTPPVPSSPAPQPTSGGKAPKAPAAVSLAVDDGGCQGLLILLLPVRCSVTLSAVGGTVSWAVNSISASAAHISTDGGQGVLGAGESVRLAVFVTPSLRCRLERGGTGTIAFSPGGAAQVTFSCR